MAGNKQSPLERASIYQPPWRRRLPSGDLGEDYGPSPSSMARKVKEYKAWNWRPEKPEEARRRVGALVAAWLDEGGWQAATDRELDVFASLYVALRSVRETAAWLGVSRSTVRTLHRRLLRRACVRPNL